MWRFKTKWLRVIDRFRKSTFNKRSKRVETVYSTTAKKQEIFLAYKKTLILFLYFVVYEL